MQDGEEDDDDWAEETTEEAQRRRMEEISDHAKNLTLSEVLEKPLEERVNLFYNFVKVSNAPVICFLCKHFLMTSLYLRGVTLAFKSLRLVKEVLYSTRLHAFDQKYSENSDIVK